MNKLLLPMLMLAAVASSLVIITACANKHGPKQEEVLVCTAHGETVFKSVPTYAWFNSNERVWKNWEGLQYQASALESCYTRRSAPEDYQ